MISGAPLASGVLYGAEVGVADLQAEGLLGDSEEGGAFGALASSLATSLLRAAPF
jgi:hypothetical protein